MYILYAASKSSPTPAPSSKFKPLGHGGVVVEEPASPPAPAPVEEVKPEPAQPVVVKKRCVQYRRGGKCASGAAGGG
jgi:hypothetical protein